MQKGKAAIHPEGRTYAPGQRAGNLARAFQPIQEMAAEVSSIKKR
jgi:hypothetical protein